MMVGTTDHDEAEFSKAETTARTRNFYKMDNVKYRAREKDWRDANVEYVMSRMAAASGAIHAVKRKECIIPTRRQTSGKRSRAPARTIEKAIPGGCLCA